MQQPFAACSALFALIILSLAVRGDEPLPGTRLLTEMRPLDQVMVAGIDRFALREIDEAAKRRKSLWSLDYASPEAYESSLQPYRDRFAERSGKIRNP